MDKCWQEQMASSFGHLDLFPMGTQKGLDPTRDLALGSQKPSQSLIKSLSAGFLMESFVPRVFVVLTTLKIFFSYFVFSILTMMCPSLIFFVFKLLGIN